MCMWIAASDDNKNAIYLLLFIKSRYISGAKLNIDFQRKQQQQKNT